jgi:GPH family glycoside/pentoside/hexuronide:cation symporter
MMYSCSSLGIKVGGALGTAICGWLLDAAGYVENVAVQTVATVNMLNFLYLWMPVILCVAVAFLLVFLNVEKANNELITSKNN